MKHIKKIQKAIALMAVVLVSSSFTILESNSRKSIE